MKIFVSLICFLFLSVGCGFFDSERLTKIQKDIRFKNEAIIENEIHKREKIKKRINNIEIDLTKIKDVDAKEALTKVLNDLHAQIDNSRYHEGLARKQANIARRHLGLKVLTEKYQGAR